MRIIGVSLDAPEKNAEWRERRGYGFELWSDTLRQLALYYGAVRHAEAHTAARVTRVLDAEGGLALEYGVGLGIAAHPQQVLDDVRTLVGAR